MSDFQTLAGVALAHAADVEALLARAAD